MVTSDADSPTDQVSCMAPFSYAQAAKGKSMQSSSASMKQALSGATNGVDGIVKQAQESKTEWSDESTDSRMTAVEAIRHDKEPSSDQHAGSEQTFDASSQVQKAGERNGVANGTSESASSTTAKDEDAASSQNPSSDSAWDSKSQGSVGVDVSKAGSEEASTKSKKNSLQDETPPAKVLKEAPIPTVNFWQRRAQDAQGRQPITSASTTDTSRQSASRNPNEVNGVSPVTTSTMRNNTTNEGQDRPDALKQTAPTTSPSDEVQSRDVEKRSSTNDGASFKRAPRGSRSSLSSARDELSWPTPDSAQDEERRKIQERGDKTGPPTLSKPHGKNEWVPVPYTPSVKFNTPLPIATKRGGRIAGRAGREIGRGGANMGTRQGSVGDDDVLNQDRGSSETEHGRSSSQSANRRKRSSSAGNTHGWGIGISENTQGALKGRIDNDYRAGPQSSDRRQSKANKDWDSPRKEQSGVEFGTMQDREHAAVAMDSGRSGHPTGSSEEIAKVASNTKAFLGHAHPGDVAGEEVVGRRGAEHAHTKQSWVERKTSTFDGHRDPNNAIYQRERGDGRSDRGRGRGGRGLSHPAANHRADTSGPLLTSPHASSRTNTNSHGQLNAQGLHYMANNRTNYRGGPRSASIPADQHFLRYANYLPGQPPSGQQPYYPSGFDTMNLQQFGAPYGSYVDQMTLIASVVAQLQYYFSIDNLLKDIFLRQHMDSQGFVYISLLSNFSRMKSLTADVEIIRYASLQIAELESRVDADGKDKVRRKTDWEQFVFPKEQRDPSARNEGPPAAQSMNGAYAHYDVTSNTSPLSPLDMGGNVSDTHFSNFSGTALPFSPNMAGLPFNSQYNPRAQQGRLSMPDSTASSRHSAGPTSSRIAPQINTGDMFPDDEVEFLTVVVRQSTDMTDIRSSQAAGIARTFSNGWTDPGSANDGHAPLVDEQTEDTSDNASRKNNLTPSHTSLSTVDLSNTPSPAAMFWTKEREAPGPLPTGSISEPYTDLRNKALQQRQNAAAGHCPHDMVLLYQFWSHFLVRNFNTRMYNEFRTLADEDASQCSSDVGKMNLVKFYSESLMSQHTIMEIVARHYVELAKSELSSKARPVLTRLRSAWRNGALNIKNRKRINDCVDAELRAELER